MGNDFEGNKKMFWKEVNRVRKGEQAREEMVKDVNGQILRDGVEVRRRWAEYFEQLLNFADVREALEEVGEAVNEMKSGKAPRLDGFPVECFKKCGMAVLEWLVILLNLSFDKVVVPMDWHGACIVPLYKLRRVTNVNVATREVLVC